MVHVGEGFDQIQPPRPNIRPGDGITLEKRLFEGYSEPLRQDIYSPETHIVAGRSVPVSRIPQSDNGEIQGLLLDLLLCGFFPGLFPFKSFRRGLFRHLFDFSTFVDDRTDDLIRRVQYFHPRRGMDIPNMD